MPFSENRRAIAHTTEVISHRNLILMHDRYALHRGMNASTHRIPSRHQQGPTWRAKRRRMEIHEIDALSGKLIDTRRLHLLVAMTTKLEIALVIREDQ